MKKIKYILLLLIATIIIAGVSCKKYPDGPLLSLHSKEHRVSGEWDVDYFSINGYDSTSYLKSSPFYGTYYLRSRQHYYESYYHFPNIIAIYYGKWNFDTKKENIHIFLDSTGMNIPFKGIGPYGAKIVTWEIRLLKEKKMWLKTNYNGKEYFVKFNLLKNE